MKSKNILLVSLLLLIFLINGYGQSAYLGLTKVEIRKLLLSDNDVKNVKETRDKEGVLMIQCEHTGLINNFSVYGFQDDIHCSIIINLFQYSSMSVVLESLNRACTKTGTSRWTEYGKKNIGHIIDKQENSFWLYTFYDK